MRHEHRAPFIASIVVVLACAGVLTHGLRTDAFVGLARLAPFRPIAAHVVEPKAVPTEAPQPQAAPQLVVAPPAADPTHAAGSGSASSGSPASGRPHPGRAPHAAHAQPVALPAPAPAPAAAAAPAPAPAAAPSPAAAPVAPVAVPSVPAPTVPAPTAPPTNPPGHTRPSVGQVVSHLLNQVRGQGRGPVRGQGPDGSATSPAPAVPTPVGGGTVPTGTEGPSVEELLAEIASVIPAQPGRGDHGRGGGGWR